MGARSLWTWWRRNSGKPVRRTANLRGAQRPDRAARSGFWLGAGGPRGPRRADGARGSQEAPVKPQVSGVSDAGVSPLRASRGHRGPGGPSQNPLYADASRVLPLAQKSNRWQPQGRGFSSPPKTHPQRWVTPTKTPAQALSLHGESPHASRTPTVGIGHRPPGSPKGRLPPRPLRPTAAAPRSSPTPRLERFP